MFHLPLILKLFRRTAGINRKRMVMTVAMIAVRMRMIMIAMPVSVVVAMGVRAGGPVRMRLGHGRATSILVPLLRTTMGQ